MSNPRVLRFQSAAFESIVNKTFVYSVFLFFNFMISFRVLLVSFIPQVELVMEAIYEFFLLFYLAYRAIRRIYLGNFKFNHLEIYLPMFAFLPVLAMFASHLEFGQPLIYGLAPYRDFYLLFGALVMYNLLRSGEITIKTVENVFVGTAWFSCIMFYTLSIFTNPADFKDTGLAGANIYKGGDVYYRFNMAFIFFGTIYYSIKAFYKKKLIYLLYAAVFAIYVTYFRLDRTSIAVTFAALGLFYVTALHPRRQVAFILAAFIPAGVLMIALIVFGPKVIDKYYLMFADAFATTTGSFNKDGVESIRIYELHVAKTYIAKNPWIGNGRVSGQWVEGGYNYFLGYFYASDVGVYGQIFMYGFLGAGFLYSQFLFALYFALKIKTITQNVLLNTCKFFLVAIALDTLTNGYLTMYAAQSITAMVLIYWYYEQDKVARAKVLVQKEEERLKDFEQARLPQAATA
jgi:hypothetical protein